MATKPELLVHYKAGWQHGAIGRDQDEAHTNVADTELMRAYQRGWNEGKLARISDAIEYCERIQHNPLMSVLMAPHGAA